MYIYICALPIYVYVYVNIYIYIYIYICHTICVTCLISKRRFYLGETLIKSNIKCINSSVQLSTWKN